VIRSVRWIEAAKGVRICDATAASTEEEMGPTHVDFGFAYDGYAIFVLHGFASCERDIKMCEYRALRRQSERNHDKSNGFDGGVSHEVVAYSQGYCDNLSSGHIFIRIGM
jgi:hypothetical protein